MSVKSKSKSKPKSPESPTPPQPVSAPIGVGIPVATVDESDFKDPNPDNPIKDILNTNGAPVNVIILKGKNLQGGDAALVHVQSGQSSEFLSADGAQKKFVQDADGNVYYGVHGFAIAPANTKPVDIVKLAS